MRGLDRRAGAVGVRMKRRSDFDSLGDGRPAKRPGGKGGRSIDLPCVLKILMPEALASGVIGKGGAVIKGIRESTGAKISLTEHNEFFPGTDNRICTAQAHTEEALNEVCVQVVGKLAECAQGLASPSDSLGAPGELKLRTLLPRAAVGALIGKGGAAIKQLREQSGAKVSIADAEGSGPAVDQVVTITGGPKSVEYVMAEVNKHVQALNQEGWYAQWASSTGALFGGGGGGRDDGYHHAAPSTQWSSGGGDGYGGSRMTPSTSSTGGRLATINGDTGVDLMINVARTLPEYVMHDARGFALSCIVPNHLVGGLIGRGGSGTKEVQHTTGTKIGIREIPGDPENRTLNISGPLSNACAAYMLMMKRFLDAEAHALPAANGGGHSGRSPSAWS